MIKPDTILQSRYRVVKLLGQGGFGGLCLARDEQLGTDVVLKKNLSGDEYPRRVFEYEARLIAKLNHPALPKAIDFFTEDQDQFLVMEFIPGEDLMQMLIKRGFAFSVEEVSKLTDQLIGALEYLHSHQVIHRNIMPTNIRLSTKGQIVLLGFGLAIDIDSQLMVDKSFFGFTLGYSPLEQITQGMPDPRDDLFSLGATLYHLLTDVAPVDAMTRARAITEGKPDPLRPANELNPRVPSLIADVLKQAMALNREHRFASASEMRKALRNATLSAKDNDDGCQSMRPDLFFTAAQQQRLSVLIEHWRDARDKGGVLPPDEQAELESLVEAEIEAAKQRAEFALSELSK